MLRNRPLSFSVVFCACLMFTVAVFAADPAARSDSAVSDILFDHDADEFASYSVRDDGFVDINFARNIPEALYSVILNELQNDPNIAGVLAGKTGPTCSRFIGR